LNFTQPNASEYPEYGGRYQSPYDALKLTQKDEAISLNDNSLRRTNQSVDSVRATHLNENTKKSALKQANNKNPPK
jgi:hypothetical protein